MEQNLRAYLKKTLKEIAIDCTIFGFHANELKILLLRWKRTDLWCLPGGKIFPDESMDDAAHRILQERTGLREIFLQQFHAFGEVNRYKNFSASDTLKALERTLEEDLSDLNLSNRVISVGYFALVEFEQVKPVPDRYSEECRWWEISEVPPLLFDHNDMIGLALKALRRQLSYQPIGYNLLPEKFTMPELQKLYEAILGRQLDRRNFQKMMLSYDILEKLPEKRRGSANRSPFLYRFDKQKYERALHEGISLPFQGSSVWG